MATGVNKNKQGIGEDTPSTWPHWSRQAQNLAAILWPSFIAACLATGLFFSQVDPLELNAITTPMTEFSSEAGYAIGFFFFWIICTISSVISVFLIRTSRRSDGTPRGPHH